MNAPEPGLARTAERQGGHRRERDHRVHRRHPGPQRPRGPHARPPPLGEHGRPERVGRGVGQPHRVGQRGHRGDGHDRAERLLAHRRALLGHVHQHDRVRQRVRAPSRGRRGPAARRRATASARCRSTTSTCPGSVIGPYWAVAVVARPEPRDPLVELLEEGGVDAVHHVHPLDADAGLPGVGHRPPGGGVGRRVEVGVGRDEQRVLPAALRQHRGERLRRRREHLPRGGGGPGERELAHPGLRQLRPGRAEPGDELKHRLGLAEYLRKHLGERLHQPLPDAGRQLARLEHDRVPGRQRVRDRPHRGEHRVVPRPDHADHAQRVVLDRGRLVHHRDPGRHPPRPQHRRGVLGRPVQVQDRVDDLQRGVVERLAGLVVHQPREPPHVPGEVRLPGHQPQPPLGEGEPAPPLGGAPRPPHRGRDLALAVDAVGGEHFAGRGVDRLERVPHAAPRRHRG